MNNRIYKFRIWDKKNNRWFHGSTDKKSIELGTDAINLFGETIIMGEILRDQNTDKSISLERLKDLEVCQFTGLKDRKGVEIYEGDIIKIKGKNGKEYHIKVVEWENDICGFNQIWECYKPFIEVIGNVWENSDLLK